MQTPCATQHHLPEQEAVYDLPATNEGARTGVMNARRLLTELGAAEDDHTAIELALAEVLNNIVEHAYEGTTDGNIELRIAYDFPHMFFRIIDSGSPMPNGRLPLGSAAQPDLEDFQQDEGGYGLFMIRQLARKLRYVRDGQYNELSFRITLGSSQSWDGDLTL